MAQYCTRRFHMVSTHCATSLHHEHELIPRETYAIWTNKQQPQQPDDVCDDDNDDDGDDTDDNEDANALWVE